MTGQSKKPIEVKRYYAKTSFGHTYMIRYFLSPSCSKKKDLLKLHYHAVRVRKTERAIATRKSDLFLDIGCGEGLYCIKLAKRGISAVGIDLSITYLRRAAKESKNLPINYILADAEYLPFRGNSFNIILCSELLEHVPNPHRVMKEIRRICKDTIVITVPNSPSGRQNPEHIHKFTFGSIQTLININGFKVMRKSSLNIFRIPPKLRMIFVSKTIIKLVGFVEELLEKVPLINGLGATALIKAKVV